MVFSKRNRVVGGVVVGCIAGSLIVAALGFPAGTEYFEYDSDLESIEPELTVAVEGFSEEPLLEGELTEDELTAEQLCFASVDSDGNPLTITYNSIEAVDGEFHEVDDLPPDLTESDFYSLYPHEPPCDDSAEQYPAYGGEGTEEPERFCPEGPICPVADAPEAFLAAAGGCQVRCYMTRRNKGTLGIPLAQHYFDFCVQTEPGRPTRMLLIGLIESPADWNHAVSILRAGLLTTARPNDPYATGMWARKFATMSCGTAGRVIPGAVRLVNNHTFRNALGFGLGVVISPVNGYPCMNVALDAENYIRDNIN